MKIGIVLGTRPEIIKMAPVIQACQKARVPFALFHSKQHSSPEMDSIFFDEFGIPEPDYNLRLEPGTRASEIGNMLLGIEPVLKKSGLSALLVQGDTNTTAAAALAGSSIGIPVGHVESGLRSYDQTMPEEVNRIMVDHLSEMLFAVTGRQRDILVKEEGIPADKVHVVGNTVADALYGVIGRAEGSNVLEELGLERREYLLATAHRPGNVDDKDALAETLAVFEAIAGQSSVPVVWPLHPRTQKQMELFGLFAPPGVRTIDPLGYVDFLKLLKESRLAITDSGGLQEEACILKVPCVTIRFNTERPETIDCGANRLVGRDPKKAVEAVSEFLSRDCDWSNPYGDGDSGKKIVECVVSRIR